MAQVHERVFAWVAVVVVIISVGALSAAVIIQQIAENNQSKSVADTSSQSSLSCADSSTTEPTFAVPAKYTPGNSITTLEKTDVSVGTGAAAKAGDCLIVKYYGALASDGTMFDENYTKPTAFAFTLGQGQVIQGWDQGLLGMKVGGERRLAIPAELAYGNTSSGDIPANSALVFYVRLLRVQ